MNGVAGIARSRQIRLMGSAFEFVIDETRDDGEELLDAAIHEVKRIERLLTEFSETSQTALINRFSGTTSVQVDAEVYALLGRCKEISSLTQGAFDITAGALKQLYNFKSEQVAWPTASIVHETLKATGYNQIDLLDDQHVLLKRKGMRIGFGAIGKGYAADQVRKIWQKKGVSRAAINASGDLTAWDLRSTPSPWRVGIANPDHPEKSLGWIPVQNGAVATSGDYEQFIERDGVRYSHTIDPKSGRPVRGIKSVTVVSASAELSDALATAVTIMGIKAGMYFIEQLPHVHCLIVNEKNEVFTSRYMQVNFHR